MHCDAKFAHLEELTVSTQGSLHDLAPDADWMNVAYVIYRIPILNPFLNPIEVANRWSQCTWLCA